MTPSRSEDPERAGETSLAHLWDEPSSARRSTDTEEEQPQDASGKVLSEETDLSHLWVTDSPVGESERASLELTGLWGPGGATDLLAPDRVQLAPAPARGHREAIGPTQERFRPRTRKRAQLLTRRLVVSALGLVVLLLIVDAAYVLVRLSSSLPTLAKGLQSAASAMREGDLASAAETLDDARANASAAIGVTRHPPLLLARVLPFVGEDAQAVAALAQAAGLAVDGGDKVLQGSEDLGLTAEGLGAALYEEGQLDLAAVRLAAPQFAEAESDFSAAVGALSDLDRPRFSLVASALGTARGELERARSTTRVAGTLLAMLPELLGEGGKARYLLAFQAPGEARGTGGLMGLFGVLIAEDGRLRLKEVGPIAELPDSQAPVNAPQWFERTYGPVGATIEWRQANSSPNFVAVAQVWLNMFQRARGERLDGAIAMDPIALEAMLPGVGPLSVGEDQVLVDSNNATELLLRDSYEQLDSAQQNELLGSVVEAFWEEIETGDFDSRALAEGLAAAIHSQHFKVYSSDAEVQEAVTDLGIEGSYTDRGPNVQLVFHNNYGVNKVDYFLHRSIATTVKFNSAGDANVSTTLTLDNEAPSAPPSLLLGTTQPGVNSMLLNVLMPKNSRLERMTLEGDRVDPVTFEDDGFPVVWKVVQIDPGATSELELTYTIPNAINLTDGKDDFVFSLAPQNLVNPDNFSLIVSGPTGARVFAEDGEAIPDGMFRVSGLLSEEKTVTVDIRSN